MPDKNIKGAMQGDLIQAIQQSSGGIKFGNMIEISGELTARTDKDAASLADVVKFFMNMAASHGQGGGDQDASDCREQIAPADQVGGTLSGWRRESGSARGMPLHRSVDRWRERRRAE